MTSSRSSADIMHSSPYEVWINDPTCVDGETFLELVDARQQFANDYGDSDIVVRVQDGVITGVRRLSRATYIKPLFRFTLHNGAVDGLIETPIDDPTLFNIGPGIYPRFVDPKDDLRLRWAGVDYGDGVELADSPGAFADIDGTDMGAYVRGTPTDTEVQELLEFESPEKWTPGSRGLHARIEDGLIRMIGFTRGDNYVFPLDYSNLETQNDRQKIFQAIRRMRFQIREMEWFPTLGFRRQSEQEKYILANFPTWFDDRLGDPFTGSGLTVAIPATPDIRGEYRSTPGGAAISGTGGNPSADRVFWEFFDAYWAMVFADGDPPEPDQIDFYIVGGDPNQTADRERQIYLNAQNRQGAVTSGNMNFIRAAWVGTCAIEWTAEGFTVTLNNPEEPIEPYTFDKWVLRLPCTDDIKQAFKYCEEPGDQTDIQNNRVNQYSWDDDPCSAPTRLLLRGKNDGTYEGIPVGVDNLFAERDTEGIGEKRTIVSGTTWLGVICSTYVWPDYASELTSAHHADHHGWQTRGTEIVPTARARQRNAGVSLGSHAITLLQTEPDRRQVPFPRLEPVNDAELAEFVILSGRDSGAAYIHQLEHSGETRGLLPACVVRAIGGGTSGGDNTYRLISSSLGISESIFVAGDHALSTVEAEINANSVYYSAILQANFDDAGFDALIVYLDESKSGEAGTGGDSRFRWDTDWLEHINFTGENDYSRNVWENPYAEPFGITDFGATHDESFPIKPTARYVERAMPGREYFWALNTRTWIEP